MDQTFSAAGVPPLGENIPAGNCQGGIFVPVQESSEMWTPPEALARGTAFPCLYSPWVKGENYDG